MNPSNEYVILVDENDQPLGRSEKLKAHQQGLLHRAFSVFLFRRLGDEVELLLQQRHLGKYHAGGLWSNTCCSHPRLDESPLEAGQRRLMEEMGIRLRLNVVDRFKYRAEFDNGLIEHELDYLLIGWDDGQAFEPNPQEVMNTRWENVESLEFRLKENPEEFTPWLGEALSVVKRYL